MPLPLSAVIALVLTQGNSPEVAWGDVPTWALFVGAFAAALIALRQLRIQQDDSARLTRQLERQQADEIDFTWCPATRVLIMITPPGAMSTAGRTIVVVSNNSTRPIRYVTSHIRRAGGIMDPVKLGVTVENQLTSAHDYQMYDPRPGARIPLIRPGYKYGFIFDHAIPDNDASHPERRTAHPFIRFTDDAGLSWEIDDDLHLKRLPGARGSWRGLLPPDPV